jgi:hypothetical protein
MSMGIDQEKKWAEELRHYRTMMKMEMTNVLNCYTADEKRNLAKSWKEKYSAIFYKELVNLAKDKQARVKVAMWDIDNFDRKITK